MSGVGMDGDGVENWRLKLNSAKVEVKVEAELGKNRRIGNFKLNENNQRL